MPAPAAASPPASGWLARVRAQFRRWARLKPGFIIIGAQRSGTTSLYTYLSEHPGMAPAARKEVHFFDNQFEQGAAWYWAQFPSRHDPELAARKGQRLITGEATPYYLFHPLAPARTAQLLPGVKLLAILRNPVDRAISHYHHQCRREHEPLSFEEAIAAETGRLAGERERMLADPAYRSLPWQWHSYRARGCYMDQIDAWLRHFPRENLCVLLAEEFYADPPVALENTAAFLGLPPFDGWKKQSFEKHNYFDYAEMSPAVRQELRDFYRPQNARLAEFLGRSLPWD